MTPSEIALLVFLIIFLLGAFIIIFMIIIGFLFGPPGPPGPPPTTAIGPNTGNPPSSCSQQNLFDSQNCCVTGVVCNTSALQFCTNGVCQCVTGSTLCPMSGFGGTPSCVFINSDIQNCGGCGKKCASGETCCNGICTDVLSNSSTGSCGGCGIVCTGANQTCCNGFCKNLTSDVQNCGACLQACAQGQFCCGGNCTGPDSQNCRGCGISCPINTICQNNTCVPGCPSGFLSCGGQCVNPNVDNNNCGLCGFVCEPNFYCSLGVCTQTVCTTVGETYCANLGYCVNLASNANHCGVCDLPCGSGPCVNGSCLCSSSINCASAYICQQSTVQTQTVQPTGATGGTIFSPGPGNCIPPQCIAGQTFCFSTQSCTTLSIDPANCSQCGTRCSSGVCQSGHCTCPAGDSQCPLGFVCIAGICELR